MRVSGNVYNGASVLFGMIEYHNISAIDTHLPTYQKAYTTNQTLHYQSQIRSQASSCLPSANFPQLASSSSTQPSTSPPRHQPLAYQRCHRRLVHASRTRQIRHRLSIRRRHNGLQPHPLRRHRDAQKQEPDHVRCTTHSGLLSMHLRSHK
jgi:hypothetical protein